ncbi:MAG: preprotein translocase subunit SecY [Minisyncoccales bacterium]
MIEKLLKAFRYKELRDKIFYILFVFFVFRLMANIPVPGVEVFQLKEFFEKFKTMGLINVFTGGTLERMSIAMLGVGPFIIAEIALELLTMVFPKLKEMYKESGEEGRKKFLFYAKLVSIPLAFLEGYGMLRFLSTYEAIKPLAPFLLFQNLFLIATASLFLVWMGDQITEKGLGNGVSLLIFAGIVSNFPSSLGNLLVSIRTLSFFSLIFFFFSLFLIIFGVVFVTQARRIIPVAYTKRVRGMKMYSARQSFLPIPVNPAGVVPIIFALSLITFPSFVFNIFSNAPGFFGLIFEKVYYFFENPIFHNFFYFLLIFLFTFFYTYIVFEPEKISDEIQKSGGFIPGIRPGKPTVDFLKERLSAILPLGGIFLGVVALSPSLVQSLTHVSGFSFLIGGTSLLIVVSVILETIKALETEIQLREYEV